MKTIVEGKRDILKLLGKQRLKNAEYRLMKYLLREQCEDGILLHNTITGEMVLLSDNEARFIDDLPNESLDVAKDLISNYYLVPVDFDEKAMVLSLRRVFAQMNAQKGINGYMILPTTECNARCAYCFEKGIHRITMTTEMANQVVDYIETHKGPGHVDIHWFGGEPLVGSMRIDQICSELQHRSIPFISVMTSNGYLFSEEVIKKAVDVWHLKKIQITLDGTEDTYNRIKAYVAVKDNPFQRVLKNIHTLIEYGIQVTLRLNVDEYNQADIKALSGELCTEFRMIKEVRIYASMIQKEIYEKPSSDTEENKRILYEQICAINDYIMSMGKLARSIELLSLKYHACMADDNRTIIIHPDGRFARCQYIHDDNSYGKIGSYEQDAEKLEEFRKVVQLDRCADCPLFPGCVELAACPATVNLVWYVCERTISKEKGLLLSHYQRVKGESKR